MKKGGKIKKTLFSMAAAALLLSACGKSLDPGSGESTDVYDDDAYDSLEKAESVRADESGELSLVTEGEEEAEPGISTMPLEISLSVTDYRDGVLTAVFSNQSGHMMYVGEDYYLQRYEDGKWADVEPVSEYSWEDIASELADLEEMEMQYDISVFGEISAGKYKLIADGLEAEFELR